MRVAIVGVGLRLSGATDLQSLHSQLCAGADRVEQIPAERLEATTIAPGTYAAQSWLSDIEMFDPAFFNISMREAQFMDPQQRIVLEVACAAIGDAGYSLASVRGTDTGVYLSAPRPDYQRLLKQSDPLELLGNAPSAAPGRISYLLDLRGPSISVDAGCCASLVAVHQACADLAAGKVSAALAGGLSLTVLPEPESVSQTFGQIMSVNGRCAAFDESADGAVAGEGGGVLFLKTLDRALADGDDVLAVISASAVGSNGFRSTGFSAPSPQAQAEVITEAWQIAGVAPSEVGVIEAHGSGTRLGDVIEIQGLREAYADKAPPTVTVGSVKTNFGHLDHAAGIAGLLKAVASVRHATVYASLHCNKLNSLIDPGPLNLDVPSQSRSWDGRRIAGVSSFSLAGTNVHAVVEGAPDQVWTSRPGPHLVTVSAKTKSSLQSQCARLAEFARNSDADPAAVAHTLNRGRDDYPVRIAAVVDDLSDLARVLDERSTSIATPVSDSPQLVELFSAETTVDMNLPFTTHPAFADKFEEVTKAGGDEVLAWHLASHALLRASGLVESTVIGSGIGNVAVRVVRDGLSIAEAVVAAAGAPKSASIDPERLATVLESAGGDHPVFVEMGAWGGISQAIEDFVGPGVFEIVRMDDLPTLLARVWEQGVPIDWEAHYASDDLPRVHLPTYEFDRVRCWCRQPGDVFGGAEQVNVGPTLVEAIGDFATPAQEKIAAVWQRALGASDLDERSDYFSLGGTSITSLTVIDGIEAAFGVRLSYQDLYEHPDLASLALFADSRSADPVDPADGLIPVIERGGLLPVSIAQEQIWFLDQMEGPSPVYNIPFDLHLTGHLDVEAMRKTIESLVHRHEVLRSRFVEVDGRPQAVIDDVGRLDLPMVDLSRLDSARARSEAVRLFDLQATTPFDLEAGPVFRCLLIVLGPQEHVLLMTFHHIVYDGWTPSILHTEINEFYSAYLKGEQPSVEPLPIGYHDYAAWQREFMSGPRLEQGLDYWRAHLEGATDLELQTDRPRPAIQSFRGDLIQFWLPEALADQLRELSRDHGVTLFTTMMAALGVLFTSWSGQHDVVIGTPGAGRRKPETRGLMGYFNNVMPMRADVSGDPTVSDLISRLAVVVSQGLDHEEIPFEKIVDAIRPNRDLSRSAIFQVAYVHQNAPHADYALPGLEVTQFADGSVRGIAPGTAKFDMTFGIGDQGDGDLEGYLEFATDLFDKQTAERVIEHLRLLLAAMVERPETRISGLNYLPADEVEASTTKSNQTARELESTQWVHERVLAWATQTPDAEALRDDVRTVTWSELDQQSGHVAAALAATGVRPGDFVAVLVPRGVDAIVSQLAVLRCGAAYVSLDTATPRPRLEAILGDCKPAAVVVSGGESWDYPTVDVRSVKPGIVPAAHVTADDLAYVIYTSGSTGTPKGVMVPHAGLRSLVDWWPSNVDYSPRDVCSQVASLSFDASLYEIWPTLCAGATLAFVPDDLRDDPQALAQWAGSVGVTRLFLPSPLMNLMLANQQWLAAAPTVRMLSAGGSALVHRPQPDLPAEVWDLYGPTETTVMCASKPVSSQPGPHDIGRPIPNAQIYVLDEHLQPTVYGVPGEICVGGVGVASGYLGRPADTACVFVPNPFGSGRLYRTGDRGRFNADGNLVFMGRIDDQVKVRGYRIEPGEIAAVASGCAGVQEAVVIARDDMGPQIALVAYCTGAATPAEVLAHVAQRLPTYMVPTSVVVLDAFPLTAAQKIDRRALPKPQEVRRGSDAPRTEIERTLAGIWAQFLGTEPGINDNYFELGGDSILSIQIVSKAREAGLRLSPRDLFAHQTIAALAAVVRPIGEVTAQQGAVSGPVTLGAVQQWFMDKVDHRNHMNQSVVIDLPDETLTSWVVEALTALTVHHDMLRLRVGESAYIAEPGDPVSVAVLDVGGMSDPQLAIDGAAADLQASLDLEAGPIVRGLHVVDGSKSRLLIVVHHMAVDAVSWSALLEDFTTLLESASQGRTQRLADKTTSFKAWTSALTVAAHRFEHELPHWLNPQRFHAIDFDLSPGTEDQAHVVSASVASEVTAEIASAAASALRLRVDEVLLAATSKVLCNWRSGRSVLIDVEGHGREDIVSGADLTRTLGWFTSIHPALLSPGDGDAATVCAEVKEQLRTASNNGIGHGLLRYLHPDASVRGSVASMPDAQVSFNYVGRGVAGAAEWGPQRPAEAKRLHALDVEAVISDGELNLSLTFNAAELEPGTALQLVDQIAETVTEFVTALKAATPRLTVSDLPLAELNSEKLGALASAYPTLADAYSLTPMQQGMLFHSLLDSGSDLYVEQLAFGLSGNVDIDTFVAACCEVTARHPVLRSAVAWEGMDEPLQVVMSEVELPVRIVDLSGPEASAKLEAELEADSKRPFDMSAAPLTRVSIFVLGPDAVYVVWTHHHLLMDGWSVQILLGELFEIYEALRTGRQLQMPVPQAFSPYVQWLRSRDMEAALDFWETTLRGFDTPNAIRVAPPQQPVTGQSMVTVSASAETYRAIDEVARKLHVTANTIVQGAWAAVVATYSDRRDVVFGATVADRPAEIAGVSSCIGLFITTVPVRVRMPNDATPVDEWLRELQSAASEQRQFLYAPLPDIQSRSAVEATLFDTILVYENYPVDSVWEESAGSLEIDGEPYVEATNYPLTVVVAPDDELHVRITYDTSRFDHDSVEAIANRFIAALESITSNPQQRVDDLTITTGSDVESLKSWSQSDSRPEFRSFIARFAQQVALHPDDVAATFGDQSITYSQLDAKARAVSAMVRDNGPEARIGLEVPRGLDMLAGLIGILGAGCASVALDVHLPMARRDLIASNTSAVLNGSAIAEAPATDLEFVEPGAGDLAYVLYTSGSTGVPKGVAISHGALSALIDWALDTFSESLSCVAAVTSIGFDLSVFELLVPLCAGGKVVICESALDLASMGAGPVLVNTVPSAMTEILNTGGLPGTVEVVNLAGEALGGPLVKRLYESGTKQVWNLYGPSEDTTYSTAELVASDDAHPSIGRPIAGTAAYVLDAQLRRVPPGVVGELYLSGAGLARGYDGRPAATAERFLPDPFAKVPGFRMYRTSDLVRSRSDGKLDYLGRSDHQVKVRGYRIELGEVEAALIAHPSVRAAAAVVHGEGPQARIAAFVTPHDLDVAAIKKSVAERLPTYMVPATIESLAEMPMTHNGKVDRSVLSDWRPPIEVGQSADLETATQRCIARMWQELLGVAEVSASDDFFDLGGHSLLATRLVSRLRETFQTDISLRAVFEAPTIAGQADVVAQAWGSADIADEIAVLAEQVDAMSPAEAQAMLDEMSGDGL